jgi:hypothetical protein
MSKLNIEIFKERCSIKHNNKYNYTLVEYNSLQDKIKIICPTHGIFEQNANSHLRSSGCRLCNYRVHSKDTFIQEATKIHGNRYDYSRFHYNGAFHKSEIICNVHGSFYQNPSNHIHNKRGCAQCAIELNLENIKNIESAKFIENAKQIHGAEYDYSSVKYVKTHSPVDIICPTHGVFTCLPSNHLRGHGCHYCSGNKINKEIFINKAGLIHGDFYDYSLVDFEKSDDNKVNIICPNHGIFAQDHSNHLSGHGCPKCSHRISSYEIEILHFLKENEEDSFFSSAKHLDKITEIDLLSEKLKIGIEFNGLYWHSSLYKTDDYHLTKTKQMNQLGYHLMHIFEDEWLLKKDICKSIILAHIGKIKQKIYARKCVIKEINSLESSTFLNNNHIQGNVNASIRLGLFYNDELVSVMTFGELRKAIGHDAKDDHYELYRFCNKLNTINIGAASKLLCYFEKKYKPEKLITYADKRWFAGVLYKQLGFKYIADTAINYFYVKGAKRYNRFAFRKNVLVEEGFDINKTERQIMLERGYNRVYDCGCSRWEKTY